jgi:hypothetical protein
MLSRAGTRGGDLQIEINGNTMNLNKMVASGNPVKTLITTVTTEFPTNKWVYMVVNVNNSIIETYLNGKLVKTVQMASPLRPSKDDNIDVGSGNLNGYITRLAIVPSINNVDNIWKTYLKGNGRYAGAMFGLLDYLDAYGFNVDIKKNNVTQRAINLGYYSQDDTGAKK